MSEENTPQEAAETPEQIKSRLNAEAARYRQTAAEAKKELDAANAKLRAHEAAAAESERKRLEEQGQWRELADKAIADAKTFEAERDALKPYAEAHKATQAAQVEVLKAGLAPQVLEKLQLSGLPLDMQLQLLNATNAVQQQLRASATPTVPTPGNVPTAGAAKPAPLSNTDYADAVMKVANSGMPPPQMRAAMEKLKAAQG